MNIKGEKKMSNFINLFAIILLICAEHCNVSELAFNLFATLAIVASAFNGADNSMIKETIKKMQEEIEKLKRH